MKRFCYFTYAVVIVFLFCSFRVHRKHMEEIRIGTEETKKQLTDECEKKIKEYCLIEDDFEDRKKEVAQEFLDKRNEIEKSIRQDLDCLKQQLREEENRRRHPEFRPIIWNEFIGCEKNGLLGFTLRRENQNPIVSLEFKDVKRNVVVEINLYDQDGIYLGRAEYKVRAGTKRIVKKLGMMAMMIMAHTAEAYAKSQGQIATDQSLTCSMDDKQSYMKKAGRWNAVADSAHKINEAVDEVTVKNISDQNDGVDESGFADFDRGLVKGVPFYYVVNVR